MDSYSSKELFNNIRNKGIRISKSDLAIFNKTDYFQVINAYKGLFIDKVETIDDICTNIDGGIDIDRYKKAFSIRKYNDANDLKNKICDFIIEKYGLSESNGAVSFASKIKLINDIKYVHHIYKKDVSFKDFYRIYCFEHELRSVLLKYTLIIENEIKKFFITCLNDKGCSSDYLVDISNYNTKVPFIRTRAVESVKIAIDLLNSKYSKPLIRKRMQNIIAPYWILINEMTMNQTLNTIDNLDEDISLFIKQTLTNNFTKQKVNVFEKSKNPTQVEAEKEIIENFSYIIKDIGEFRNMLAHNQPIFNYNIKDCSLENYPTLNYLYPVLTNKKNQNAILVQQQSQNAALIGYANKFFGQDFYNTRTSNINIDLSFIIYMISRLINQISPRNSFKTELLNVYKKYHVLIIYRRFEHINDSAVEQFNSFISGDTSLNEAFNELNDALASGKPYKRKLKRLKRSINENKNNLEKNMTILKLNAAKSEYNLFPYGKEYTMFTNIDAKFLNKL